MAISPPSDIILDVARAADPVREQRAVARLSRAAPAESEPFDRIFDAGAAVTKKSSPPSTSAPVARPPAMSGNAAKVYRDFEAMALASMIESAMPKDSDAIFGSGTAGRAWKSMLAEQLGIQMAEAGGIGLAAQLASGSDLGRQPDGAEKADLGSVAESLLVTQIERGFVDAAIPDAASRDEELSS